MERYQMEYVEKLAESIPPAISVFKINERTKSLLLMHSNKLKNSVLRREKEPQNKVGLAATQER